MVRVFHKLPLIWVLFPEFVYNIVYLNAELTFQHFVINGLISSEFMSINSADTWSLKKNSLVFPFGWQEPAKTEFWASIYLGFSDPSRLSFFELIHFPWATLIDSRRKNNYDKVDFFLKPLSCVPPKKTLIRATVCQHIYAMDLLELFKRLKITDLYWPHAVIDHCAIDGIRIHPFPLYPVACEVDLEAWKNFYNISDRSLLYSFIGAYKSNLYLTPVRKWIFELLPRPDAIVVKRNEWYFEKQVYDQQISGRVLSVPEKLDLDQKAFEYKSVLAKSIFSLCPSGSGPNSIRLWESLGFGCIPVLLSDTLRLPGDQDLWDQAIVRVREEPEAVARLPSLLSVIAQDERRLLSMKDAGKRLWELYGLDNGPQTILSELASKEMIRKYILG
jgi:hypothetical protein